MALGDVTGDGRLDILVTSGGNSDGTLSVFSQNSSGIISTNETANYPSYDIPQGVATGDLDGDGLTDAVVWHDAWIKVGVYLQSAGGGLGQETLFALTKSNQSILAQSVAVADLNGDGKNDVVAVCDGGVQILYHN